MLDGLIGSGGVESRLDQPLMNALALALRFVVGVVLLASAAGHVRDPRSFQERLQDYRVPAARLMAWAIPFIESIAGISWLLNLGTLALAISAPLLTVYTAGMLLVLSRGEHVPCGCGGVLTDRRVGIDTVLRNVGLLTLAGVAGLGARGVDGPLQLIHWLGPLPQALVLPATSGTLLLCLSLADAWIASFVVVRSLSSSPAERRSSRMRPESSPRP